MRAQIRGMRQAVRNAQDGISLIQTAEGYMQTVTDMAQRLNELIIQAANDTYDGQNRVTIHNEIKQITEEINNIWTRATFNGQNLFGREGGVTAANVFNTISVPAFAAVTVTDAVSAGAVGTTNGVAGVNFTWAANILTVGTAKTGFVFTAAGSQAAIQTALQGAVAAVSAGFATWVAGHSGGVGGLDFAATAIGNIAQLMNADASAHTAIGVAQEALMTLLTNVDLSTHLWTTETPADVEAVPNSDSYAAGLATWLNAQGITAGTVAAPQFSTSAAAASALGIRAEFFDTANLAALNDAISAGLPALVSLLGSIEPTLLNNALGFNLQVGPNMQDTLKVDVTTFVGNMDDAINNTFLARIAAAWASDSIDHAQINALIGDAESFLRVVNELRAALGATQNRLEFTVDNLNIAAENLSAAESRIRDADMAAEMMQLTKANVLQQAATAMLAQANQAPQSILQLLG
jgi:flagellin